MSKTLPKITLYQILQLPESASTPEIKKAYHKLAKKYHPDKIPDNATQKQKEATTEKFRILKSAYELLSDEKSKKDYDQQLSQNRKNREFELRQKLEKEAEKLNSRAKSKIYKDNENNRSQQEFLNEMSRRYSTKNKNSSSMTKLERQKKEQERYVENLMRRRSKANNIRQQDQWNDKYNEYRRNLQQQGWSTPNFFQSNAGDTYISTSSPFDSQPSNFEFSYFRPNSTANIQQPTKRQTRIHDFASLIEENIRRNGTQYYARSHTQGPTNLSRHADQMFDEFFRQ